MISKNIRQFKLIEGASGKDIEEQLNKIAQKNTIIRYEYSHGNGHSIFMEYETYVEIPEDIRDEYELKGIKFYCYECPFFHAPTDRRIKYWKCPENPRERCAFDRPACIWFFEQYAKGEIVPNGTE